MGNFTLGRLLAILLPGTATLFLLLHFLAQHSMLPSVPILPDGVKALTTALGPALMATIAIVLGVTIDNFRVWWVEKIFIKHLNFYGLFRYWLKPSYLKARIARKELVEIQKPFAYWHRQYTDAYQEAYLFWLGNATKKAEQTIDLARHEELKHVLYGLRQSSWTVQTPKGPKETKISITNGQIWPILATKQKDAFKFYQEYFFSDLSSNLLIVVLLGFLLAVLNAIVSPEPLAQISSAGFWLVAYVGISQIATRHHLAQIRFFRFVLLYDTLGALEGTKPKKSEAPPSDA